MPMSQNRKGDEQNHKWNEEIRKGDEESRKWEESKQEFRMVHEKIMALAKKNERSIDALGARWGMQSEAAFRNTLAGILEENFGVKVVNVTEFDETGEVFGRPDQIEIDVIIKNGILILCEIKSSVDKPAMYMFERKARFYEKLHQTKATRLVVISPMIDKKARKVGETLGIEMYSDSEDVEEI